MEPANYQVGDAVQVDLARTMRAFRMIEAGADTVLPDDDEPMDVEGFTAGCAHWASAVVTAVLGEGRYVVRLTAFLAEAALTAEDVRQPTSRA